MDLLNDEVKIGDSVAVGPQPLSKGLRGRCIAILSSERLIYAILVFSIVARCGFAFHKPNPDLEWDAGHYRAIAHHLASGDGYTETGQAPETYWAPLTPFLIAGVYRLGGGDLAVREVWAVLGTCLVWVVYLLARVKHSLTAANLAAAATAIYPYNLAVGASTSTEIPNNLLLLLVILTYTLWTRSSKLGFALLAGLALGLATLNRPAGFVFLPWVALFFLFGHFTTSRRVSVSSAVAFLLAALLLITPWAVRTSRITGNFSMVTSGGAWNLWFGNNPWLEDYLTGRMDVDQFDAHLDSVVPPGQNTQKERDSAYLSGFRQFVQSHPLEEFHLLAFKTMQFWKIPGVTDTATHATVKPLHWVILLVGFLSYVPLMAVGFLSAVYMSRKGRIGDIGIYIFWIFMTYASYIWFPAVNRFRFAGAVDNLTIILSVAVIPFMADHAKNPNRPAIEFFDLGLRNRAVKSQGD